MRTRHFYIKAAFTGAVLRLLLTGRIDAAQVIWQDKLRLIGDLPLVYAAFHGMDGRIDRYFKYPVKMLIFFSMMVAL